LVVESASTTKAVGVCGGLNQGGVYASY
jgi:hypothetical protein